MWNASLKDYLGPKRAIPHFIRTAKGGCWETFIIFGGGPKAQKELKYNYVVWCGRILNEREKTECEFLMLF